MQTLILLGTCPSIGRKLDKFAGAPARGQAVALRAEPLRGLTTIRTFSNWKLFEKALLVCVVFDLALGGNGYLVKIGPFRLREVLFVVCVTWAVARLTVLDQIRLAPPLIIFSIAFAVLTVVDASLGYINGNRIGAIAAELKPLCYFPMLLFFLVAIRTRNDLTLVASIIVSSGIIVASLYLMLLLAAKIGIVSYSTIHDILRTSDEFIFRTSPFFVGFLYKGMFYVCIASLFLLFDPFRATKLFATLTIVATSLTLTRGLCLALVVCILSGIVLQQRWHRAPLLLGQVGLLVIVLFFGQQTENRLLIRADDPPGKSSLIESIQRPTDSFRTDDFKFVVAELNWSTVAIGRGFGAPIRGRERIEVTYLEILYKQGVPGLLLWFALFIYTFHLYLRVPRESRDVALPCLLSSLFVYVATASNTFLTGSIGMAVVFIAIAGLLVLSRESHSSVSGPRWYEAWLEIKLRSS